jgi:8-oxo-dGTP pyrophosphatase MutT (NUDIX family)
MIDRSKLPYRQGVVAYVCNSLGKYLIFQHPDWEKDKWRVPGGGIRDGENYEQAIKREMLEEFGLNNFEIKFLSNIINTFEWPDDLIEKNIADGKTAFRGQQQKQVLIQLDNIPEIIIDPLEVADYKWVDVSEFVKFFVHPGQNDIANQVIDDFKKNGY